MEIRFDNKEVEEILKNHVRNLFPGEMPTDVGITASVPYSSGDYTVTIEPKEND